MQILIISLPNGEQVTSLSHTIDAAEALIGQSSRCQILLPDRQEQVAERHARICREDDRWYLENISDTCLLVNNTEVRSGRRQRFMLTDGDVISCGDYRLMVSNFSPWQTELDAGLDTPTLDSEAVHTPEFCIIPVKDPTTAGQHIDDPFEQPMEAEPANNLMVATDVSMTRESFSLKGQPQNSTQPSPLIDVLAEDAEEDDDDWSINRHLWAGSEETLQPTAITPVPILSELATQKETQQKHNTHHRSVCEAMLQSLEQFMQDISPDNLKTQFKNHAPPADQINESYVADYWSEYQKYYQQMINDQSYRLLFLHRFRQALKQQEQR